MAKFCTNCGKELPEGALFCTGCGTRVQEARPVPEPAEEPAAGAAEVMAEPEPPVRPAAPAVIPEPEPRQEPPRQEAQEPPPQEEPQSPYRTEPQPQAAYPTKPAKAQKPVSTIGFMLLQLLYAIPIVGFFASLVLAIAPEKKDLKHHALANFLWKIIFLALLIFGFIRAKKTVETHWDEWSSSFSEVTGGNSLDDILNAIQSGDISGIMGDLGEGA